MNTCDDAQIIRQAYNPHARTQVLPNTGLAPPDSGYLNVERPALGDTMPAPAGAAPTAPTVIRQVIESYNARKSLSGTPLLLEHLKRYPDMSPNSPKIASQFLRLFSTEVGRKYTFTLRATHELVRL